MVVMQDNATPIWFYQQTNKPAVIYRETKYSTQKRSITINTDCQHKKVTVHVTIMLLTFPSHFLLPSWYPATNCTIVQSCWQGGSRTQQQKDNDQVHKAEHRVDTGHHVQDVPFLYFSENNVVECKGVIILNSQIVPDAS